ncbi:ATP-binding protein [Paenibacillus darwinianus]|uniref:ATP-binding protein n=1 Tax=Paenibacillus darwinianus TaxID=1380763 RepID=UPI001680B475|nr:ATP-binding protein [Paenibacillus darwinianus]
MTELGLVSIFLTNTAILITCAYLFNMGYKYLFAHTSEKVRQAITVIIFIVAGFLTILFGFRINETAITDLRMVPIILAALVFRNPRVLIVISLGIALLRLTLHGVNPASTAGVINLLVLGVTAAGLVMLFERRNWPFARKAVISIVVLNTLNMVNLAIFGILPPLAFLTEVAVVTYPLGIALSAVFIFIVRDFYKEQQRIDDLRNMNLILRRQTRELREAKRELEEKARQIMLSSQYKSEFMANMSHELKTPLNSIILLSQLMRDDDERYGSDDIRYADLIHTAGNDLLQLINDILDLSKVEAGKMDIVWDTVSVADAVQLIGQQFEPVAARKCLFFEYEVAEGVPATIVSDGLRMNQILRNLLANAFKFTDRGEVRLTVTSERIHAHPLAAPLRRSPFLVEKSPLRRLMEETRKTISGGSREAAGWKTGRRKTREAEGPADTWVVFTVRDTGIGIDKDKQRLIFEAFQQGDGSINRKYGGTGLGLSISLQLTRLLGGELSLVSEKDQGSSFTLRLPVKPPLSAYRSEHEEPEPAGLK